MGEIKPRKKRPKSNIAQLEISGSLSALVEEMNAICWSVKNAVDKLHHEDFLHLQLNVETVKEELDDLVKVFERYRTLQQISKEEAE